MTEAEFQRSVIELAHRFGYKVAHFRPAQTKSGHWVTPVQADGAGFPDLVLVRDRVIFAELKSETGQISLHQAVWEDALRNAGAEYYCWKPSDWDEIEANLRRRAAA
jgi:hypothetical protein